MKTLLKEYKTASQTFLEKARTADKASECKAYLALSTEALAHAQAIERDLQGNSALLYIEVLLKRGTFEEYLDFCARNNLEMLARADFEAVMTEIFGKPI